MNLAEHHLPSTKTLGVQWLPKEDCFVFTTLQPTELVSVTKRQVLSRIATLFDPLGFLSPYIIRGKMLLQEIWLAGINWDDALGEELNRKFKKWNAELTQLQYIRVPRCLQQNLESEDVSIHIFSDASNDAYATAAYMRTVSPNGVTSVQLIASKSKVAPLEATSMPRLELVGALLSTKMSKAITKALQIDAACVRFWTDSMDVLWWLQNRSRALKVFVGNRVAKIQKRSSPSQWGYVKSECNPADLPTRGLAAEELHSSTLWWCGPSYLQLPEEQWPVSEVTRSTNAIQEVCKGKAAMNGGGSEATFVTVDVDVPLDWRLDPSRFSSWVRLKRVYAWTRRFIRNCRIPGSRAMGELTVDELLDAENAIIRSLQQEHFQDEYRSLGRKKPIEGKSKLLSLNPFLDEDGLMRANSRLKNADYLPFSTRFPVILPRRTWVTKLVVRNYHRADGHVMGTNHTLASLSARFWVMAAREEIRQVESECYTCKRRKAKAVKQIMAPLPSIRLNMPFRAFSRVAVDFGGPFTTMQGRGKKRLKRYLCLFTCLLSRAVHLEMAYGLDTDAFLNAFYRMTSRRGLPVEMLSDNGSNFVGAERELRELLEALDKEKIKQSGADRGIKWTFNPPLAPHFGGVHESMIKSAKRAIKAVLGNANVTDEELMTAFVGAEGLINSRPLTFQSANPEDQVPLTPNHFLHGQAGGEFAPSSVDQTDFGPRKRWRRLQELMRHVWSRWIREWLPSISRRLKWQQQQKNITVGELVLVMAADVPRGQWPLGKVLETYPGNDGNIRSVKVLVNGKEYVRPVVKTCPIDVIAEGVDE